MTATNTFGSAVRWNFIGSAVRVTLTLFCQLILLRMLGPTVAGQFAIFLTVVGFGTVLSEGGMLAALTRAKKLDEATIRNALFLVLCYAAIVAGVLFTLMEPLMRIFHLGLAERYIPLVAVLNIVPLGLSSVPLSILRRQYRSRDVQLVQTGAYALGFAVVALPLALNFQSAAVMVAAFSVQTIATLIGAMWLTRCPILPRVRGARAVQATSWRALTSNIAFYLSESAAGVLTAHMIGARALGLYGTALNLLRMPTDVLVTTLHAPLLVSASQDHGGVETRHRFLTTLNVLAGVVFPVFFTVYLTGGLLVVPLLGAKWGEAGPVLSIVGLVMMVRLLSMLSGAVVWGRGRFLADSAAQAISFLVVVGAFLLIRPAAAPGVAWVVFASVTVRMAIQLTVAVRACAITLRMLWRSLILPLLLTAAVMWPIGWIAPLLLPRLGFLGFLGVAAAAAGLLVVRLALGMWLTPDTWTHALMARLPIPTRRSGGRAAAITASRDPAAPDRTLMSTTEIP